MGKNLCEQCGQVIAEGAKRCHLCKSWQGGRRLFNFPLIPSVMMAVAIVQVILGFGQLLEAKKERVLASEALKRVEEAERKVISIANNVDRVEGKIKVQEKSITGIVARAEAQEKYIEIQRKTIDVILDRVKQKFDETVPIK